MITYQEYCQAQRIGAGLIRQAGVAVLPNELEQIAVADFGLSRLEVFGAQILTLVSAGQIAVKLIALSPAQTLPEHSHPHIGSYAGKEETIRCAWGELYLYGPGQPTPRPKASLPPEKEAAFLQRCEQILQPGGQATFPPNTPHWFQAGPQGAVVWSFSTKAIDLQDVFTDPNIRRETIIVD